jgi:hypothetical protein
MQRSEQTSHAPLALNAVSIADGVAAVTISPFTHDLTQAERTAILAADRQRVFICARDGAPFSGYPTETLKWCIRHASLICLGALEHGSTSEKDVEALLSQFDRDDVSEHRFVIRVIVDARFDIAEYPWFQRPHDAPLIIRSRKRATVNKTSRASIP